MLSRPATKITLTTEDLIAYEQRRAAREAAKYQSMDDSSTQELEDASTSGAYNNNPIQANLTKEQRLGIQARNSGR